MQWASKMFGSAGKMVALRPTERRFLVFAWLLAPAANALLARRGFEGALRALARTPSIPRPRKNRRADELVGIERAESLVKSAFIRQPTKRGCLPQALVQFLLHRRYGPAPRLVIGVARRSDGRRIDGLGWDLEAHAWLEQVGGPARDGGYSPILSYSDEQGLWRARAE
jgi:hypothetical protein